MIAFPSQDPSLPCITKSLLLCTYPKFQRLEHDFFGCRYSAYHSLQATHSFPLDQNNNVLQAVKHLLTVCSITSPPSTYMLKYIPLG